MLGAIVSIRWQPGSVVHQRIPPPSELFLISHWTHGLPHCFSMGICSVIFLISHCGLAGSVLVDLVHSRFFDFNGNIQ